MSETDNLFVCGEYDAVVCAPSFHIMQAAHSCTLRKIEITAIFAENEEIRRNSALLDLAALVRIAPFIIISSLDSHISCQLVPPAEEGVKFIPPAEVLILFDRVL